MTSRPPSQPPELPGYQHLGILGSGGFADVFLYRQERPQRDVAIKVLLAGIADPVVRRQFDSEADVMATLSTHPSIITIHHADVSADGRPFLVMEYCSRPGYGARFRTERISVAEALAVGIQIAGAVETAHRAGILHRDIKPANILLTEYNRPALTDFGISIAAGEAADIEETAGMSIPWAPPEMFADPPRADERSDVFALAATVYSLLAGRTPFERPGHRSTADELIHRIETEPLAPLERPDAPASLSRVLSVAMAKDPAGRYESALSFGRALQQVEAELALPVTPMDVLEDRAEAIQWSTEDEDEDAHTRIRAITTIEPDAPTSGPTAATADPFAAIAAAPATPVAAGPSMHAPAAAGEATAPTVLGPAGSTAADPGAEAGGADGPGDPADDGETRPRRIPAWMLISALAAVVIALGIGASVLVGRMYPATPTAAPSQTEAPASFGAAAPRPPADVQVQMIRMPAGTVEKKAQIRWRTPEGFAHGDFYQVHWDVSDDEYPAFTGIREVRGRTSTVMNAPPPPAKACAVVVAVRPDGASSTEARACAP